MMGKGLHITVKKKNAILAGDYVWGLGLKFVLIHSHKVRIF